MEKKVPLITAAVTGLCFMPLTAGAQEESGVNVYGRVNVGMQHVNDDGVNVYGQDDNDDTTNVYGQDEGLGLMDVDSRFGLKGNHEVNDGLTALYHFEFAVDATEATIEKGDRLSWVGLEGDFGRIKAGRMWSAWYTYLGWNTDRSQFWGGPGYYGYPAFGFNQGMPDTRTSNTVQYTYGGGGYSTQPFTFTAEVQMDGHSTPGTGPNQDDAANDPQDVDLATLAAMGTIGPVQVNGAVRQQSSNDPNSPAEPSQAGVGVRWNNGPLYLGGSYIQTDRDNGTSNDSPSVVEVLGTYEFGGGLSGQLSVSQLDNDMPNSQGDTTGFFALVNQSLTEQLNVYGEIQSLDVDGGNAGPDTSPRVILVGMGYSFP